MGVAVLVSADDVNVGRFGCVISAVVVAGVLLSKAVGVAVLVSADDVNAGR